MFFFKKNKKNDFDEVYDKLFDKIDLWLTKPNANNMQITQYNAAQKKKNFIDDNQDARMFLVSIITKMESMKNKDKGELKALKSLEQAFDAFNAIGNEKIKGLYQITSLKFPEPIA